MAIRRSALRALSGRYMIALGVAGVFMVGSVLTVNYVIDQKLSNVKRVSVKTAPAPPQGANYLLLGSDTRAFVKNQTQQKAFGSSADNQGQRSDTMMVIHVEPGSKKTLAVSFPRDLWVNIPGMGMNKINAAFNAGPDKVIETLKDDFNIQINHFIEVDFQSFQGVVNAIGRVPVYFPYPARDLNTGLGVELGGCVLLDGSSALAYTRSRELEFLSLTQKQWFSADPTADIGRIARQQQFIRELAGIAVQRSLNNPLTANTVVDRVLQNLTIDQDLSKTDIFDLVDAFRTVNTSDTSNLDFQTLPWAAGPDQAGQSVLYVKEPDDQPLLARLRDFTSTNPNPPGLTVKPSSVKVQVVDGTGGSLNAPSVLNDLVQKAGFVSGGTSNALAPVATTEVRYGSAAITKGELVLNYLSPQARLVADPSLKSADVSVVLGKDFKGIVLPSAGSTTTGGPSAGVPVAGPPPSTDNTAATTGTLDPAKFGPPIAKTPPCR